MANELARLYRELGDVKQTPDIRAVRKTIENKLNEKLRDNFLEVLEIGGVVGYDKLEKELERSRDLVAKLNKEIKRK